MEPVEKARCECCGFTEECTPAYIAAVRAEHMGRWVCGLCAEAVGDEVVRRAGAGERITTAEALDRHVAFARAPRAPAEDDLVAAVARLLRRCLVDSSPPASPAAARPEGGRGARMLRRRPHLKKPLNQKKAAGRRSMID